MEATFLKLAKYLIAVCERKQNVAVGLLIIAEEQIP